MSPDQFQPDDVLAALPRNSDHYALFVDFDGTLAEIAATPDGVVAPSGLADLLSALTMALQGALAIVSGRPIADVDAHLNPFRGRAAGVHGAEIRADPGEAPVSGVASLDRAVLDDIRRMTAFDPRILVEDKGASIAVHYRMADDVAPLIEPALARYVAAARGEFSLLRGRKIFEILRGGVSKGDAVARFMATPDFAGRRPIMIGDDRTDVSAMEACAELGGWGFRVAGEFFPASAADFSGPAAVRLWLADFLAGLTQGQETAT
jgi:trehalose 6-phosphate phosphatase